MIALTLVGALCALAPQGPAKSAPKAFAVRAETLYTMAGAPVTGGVVVVRDGKIAAVGDVDVPAGLEVVEAKVVMPGLIDAHATVGLSGVLNVPQDQDQLDASSPTQPELRALDAYHARDPLVEWVRGLGVTTLHTGHGPGALISGQTMVVKTHGRSVDADVVEVERGAGDAGDAVDDEQRARVAHAGRDRAQVGQHAGAGLGVHHRAQPRRRRAHRRQQLVRRQRAAERDLHRDRLGARAAGPADHLDQHVDVIAHVHPLAPPVSPGDLSAAPIF